MRTTFIVKELAPPTLAGKATVHGDDKEVVEVLGLLSLLAGRPIAPKLTHVHPHSTGRHTSG